MNHTSVKVAVHFDTTTSTQLTKWLPTLLQHNHECPIHDNTKLYHNLNMSKSNNSNSRTQVLSITVDTAIRIDLYPAGVYYFTHTT